MAKKKQKRQLPAPPAATSSNWSGIVVPQIEMVTSICRDTIESIIDKKYLKFNQENLAGRRFKCMLIGGAEAISAYVRETYSVHRFLEKGSDLYWLAVVLYFQFERGEYRLESAGLLVFKGVANDPIKTALLRAEWDCTDRERRTIHAQPHWHVYLSAITKERERPTFDDPIEIKEFDSPEDLSAEMETEWQAAKFHFAMASNWHATNSSPQQVPLNQVEELTSWIKGCINYTRAQLNFLSS